MTRTLPSLVAFLLLVVGGGLAIGLFTLPGEWYAALVKPSFNPLDSFEIGGGQLQALDIANARRQNIGIDDPDGAPKRLDVGMLIGAAFAGAVRAGDNQKDWRLSAHLPQDPESAGPPRQ